VNLQRFAVFLCVVGLPNLLLGHDALSSKTAKVNGVKIYYRISQNDKPPLLLLHAFASSGDHTWNRRLRARLSQRYRLIIPDLRGHGRSTNPTKSFTHRQAAEDIYGLLDHLGIRRFKAIGVSTGGMTLLHMATKSPDRVETMVLVSATHYFPATARKIMARSTPNVLQKQAGWDDASMGKIHFRGAEQIRLLRRQFHHFHRSYADMNFTRPLLGTIKARTLIMHGDQDPLFPIAIPVAMHSAIPASSLWIVPSAGHIPFVDSRGKANKLVPFAERSLLFLSK